MRSLALVVTLLTALAGPVSANATPPPPGARATPGAPVDTSRGGLAATESGGGVEAAASPEAVDSGDASGRATGADTPDEKIPLLDNFSILELTTIGAMTTATAVLWIGEESIFSDLEPSMGPPTEGSVDWKVTHDVNPDPDPDRQLLGGVPDRFGNPIYPLATGLFYLTGAIGSSISDDFFLGDMRHELFAYIEALSWTLTTTLLLKNIVGRRRPYATRPDLVAEEFDDDEHDSLLSFPSGHSSGTAVVSAFVYLDLSDYLYHDVMRDSPGVVRYLVGRVAPFVGTYGLTALVMYSRIYDQRHWLSDTLTGALIGASFGNIFYLLHFDSEGNPRRPHADDDEEGGASAYRIQDARTHPVVFDDGTMGVGYGFRF
jgi:membrane-associated phospholipid phosphatase